MPAQPELEAPVRALPIRSVRRLVRGSSGDVTDGRVGEAADELPQCVLLPEGVRIREGNDLTARLVDTAVLGCDLPAPRAAYELDARILGGQALDDLIRAVGRGVRCDHDLEPLGRIVELEPWCGHDLGLPYLMVQRGRRAVYDPDAVSVEKPSRDLEDEYRRKVRMLRGAWVHVFRGMLRRVGPVYFVELVSHRLLRYGSGILHLLLLVTSIALVGEGWVYRAALLVQVAWLALAAAGRLRLPIPGAGLAYYYLLVTWATLAGLVRYLRFGPPLLWERIEGTR